MKNANWNRVPLVKSIDVAVPDKSRCSGHCIAPDVCPPGGCCFPKIVLDQDSENEEAVKKAVREERATIAAWLRINSNRLSMLEAAEWLERDK